MLGSLVRFTLRGCDPLESPEKTLLAASEGPNTEGRLAVEVGADQTRTALGAVDDLLAHVPSELQIPGRDAPPSRNNQIEKGPEACAPGPRSKRPYFLSLEEPVGTGFSTVNRTLAAASVEPSLIQT